MGISVGGGGEMVKKTGQNVKETEVTAFTRKGTEEL